MSQTPRSRPDSYQRLGSVPVPGSHNDNLDNVQIEVPHGQQPQEHVEHRAYNDTMPIVNQAMPIDTQYSQPHEPQEPQAYYQMLSYPSLAVSTEHEPPQQFQPDQKASYEVAVPIDQSLNHEISSQPSVTSTSHTLLPPPQPYGSLPPPGYSEPPQKGLPAETAVIEMDTIHAGGQNVARIAANLQTNKMVRLAFVRKVYTLLAAQLAVTIGISFWFINDPSVKNWATNHQWLFFVSWGLALLDLCLLYWLRQKHPWNIILLFVFTLCISYAVATVVSVYDTRVVLQAFLITFGVFLALVVFTLQSKIDFESWGPFLYAFLWVVIFAGFIAWLFPPDRGFHVAISGLSALLFSGYIIYDTYMIFNKLSPEEYILAAIDLYLDIVNLFIAVLALLGGTDS